MPSIKKKVSGFIRQFSTPLNSSPRPLSGREGRKSQTGPGRGGARSPSAPPGPRGVNEKCFISRYLGGETRPPQNEIHYGKTGFQLPVFQLGNLDPEVFAAYTGPGGGLTCITRSSPVPVPVPGSERAESQLDFIDNAAAASRRQSIAQFPDAHGKQEFSAPRNPDKQGISPGHNTFSQEFSSSGNSHKQKLPQNQKQGSEIGVFNECNGHGPKVPKSPTNYIDNSVMNIRVGDRIYKVDDTCKLKSLPYVSPDSESCISLAADTTSQQSVTSGRYSQSPAPAPVCSPEYMTSEVVDIDTELDLIETEDGYMPVASLSSLEEEDDISTDLRKRVTIRSPKRPNSLNLGSQSRLSLKSAESQAVSENGEKNNSYISTNNGSSQLCSPLKRSPTKVGTPVKHLHNNQAIKSKKNGSDSVDSDYPELQSNIQNLVSPSSNSLLNDTSVIDEKLERNMKDDISTPIAGVRYWNRPNDAAYGLSDTLYELHPNTGEPAGSPIADTFAIVARKNSAIMVLGDGVNWGPRAALASRAAVHGAVSYLNQAIFGVSRARSLGTGDVFQLLLRAFHCAHCTILEEGAMLTTLTAAVVVPTKDKEGTERFHLCVCNVGDSLAYVYSGSSGQVREATLGSHDITANRDMRDALGALGPVDGLNPELSNLTCSLTEVQNGDIVFLTSDGISDNFDPVVGKFCMPKKPERAGGAASGGRAQHSHKSHSELSSFCPVLPTVEAFQRHELTLLRMEDILNHGSGTDSSSGSPGVSSAGELCHRMLDFCQRLTTAKRKILEDPELYPRPEEGPDKVDQKVRRRRVCEKLALVPGKLDHATLTAYQVGDRSVSLAGYQGDRTECVGNVTPGLALSSSTQAPHASCEDLTLRESPLGSEEGSLTPTASISLCSGSGASSLAATPTHETTPHFQDI